MSEQAKISQQVKIAIPVSTDFLSNVLITAFDGSYGSSWAWFHPADCDKLDPEDRGPDCHGNPFVMDDSSNVLSIWREVHVVVGDETTGINVADNNKHIVVTHASIVQAMQRILDDDYVGVWRPATDQEQLQLNKGYLTRRHRETEHGIEIHTGETAEGWQGTLGSALAQDDAGMVDSNLADYIVQVAILGKVVFA